MAQKKAIKLEFAASDKLDVQFEKLIQLEKQTASEITSLKKQIEQAENKQNDKVEV